MEKCPNRYINAQSYFSISTFWMYHSFQHNQLLALFSGHSACWSVPAVQLPSLIDSRKINSCLLQLFYAYVNNSRSNDPITLVSEIYIPMFQNAVCALPQWFVSILTYIKKIYLHCCDHICFPEHDNWNLCSSIMCKFGMPEASWEDILIEKLL